MDNDTEARRAGLAEIADLVMQRHDLWRRYDRAADDRLNLADLTRRLDSNAREIADRLAADCACGCSDDMHVGEIGCPCALPGESRCGPPLLLLRSIGVPPCSREWCPTCEGWGEVRVVREARPVDCPTCCVPSGASDE